MQQVVPFGLHTFGTRAVDGHVDIRVEDSNFTGAFIVVQMNINPRYCVEGAIGD